MPPSPPIRSRGVVFSVVFIRAGFFGAFLIPFIAVPATTMASDFDVAAADGKSTAERRPAPADVGQH
jgi:hypothetical protein